MNHEHPSQRHTRPTRANADAAVRHGHPRYLARGRRIVRQRGTSMIEMVVVMPMLIFIFLMLIFFGRGMMRTERAVMNVRYENWRHATDAPGPQTDGTAINGQLNATFFGSNAQTLAIEHHREDQRVEAAWVDAAMQADNETAEFAASTASHLPAHLGTKLRVRHQMEPIYEAFEGEVLRRHQRMHSDWRYADGWRYDAEADAWHHADPYRDHDRAIRDRYLGQLDNQLEYLAGGNTLAQHIRGVYLGNPGYRGPEINY